MNQIALFGRTVSEGRTAFIRLLLEQLQKERIALHIYEPFFKLIKHLLPDHSRISVFQNHEQLRNQTELLVTIGGDGTLLEAVTLVRDSGMPLLGINTGRLGFLTTFSKEEISETIQTIKNQSFIIDSRSLLSIETTGSHQPFGDIHFALNDITLHKKDTSSMIQVNVSINQDFLNTYWADGLIVSTPTGSTGYSLSCGGPLMMPAAENFSLTPIAPHNLNVRPMVLSDKSELHMEVESRSRNYLISLDSRAYPMHQSQKIIIRKAGFRVQLARRTNQDFLHTIREKLNWGFDKRN